MTYVFDRACEGIKDSVSLFNLNAVDTSIESVYTKDFKPLGGQIVKGSTIEFDVFNNSPDYVLLDEISLVFGVSIKNDKEKIAATDNVSLINLPGASLFRQVDFSIQQQNVSASVGTNYPYKAMLDCLLEHGKEEHKAQFAMAGYVKNSGSFDLSDNNGFTVRKAKTENGITWYLKTKLHIDILNQHRYLLNGLPLNLKLYPTQDLFCLQYDKDSDEKYLVEITDATLHVPFARVQPAFLAAQAELLNKTPALYPHKKSEIKTFNIAKGSHGWSMDNIFQDAIPQRLVLTFVDSAAYTGCKEKSPFNFKHWSLNYLDFQVNGQSFNGQVLQPDFINKKYLIEYSRLFPLNSNRKEHVDISYAEFAEGYTIYVFETHGTNNSSLLNPMRRGQTRITAKFSSATSEPITVIAYAQFESLMKVDYSRNVYIEG